VPRVVAPKPVPHESDNGPREGLETDSGGNGKGVRSMESHVIVWALILLGSLIK
jgi:hypothetical protein